MNTYQVRPGQRLSLNRFDPDDTGAFADKEEGKRALDPLQEELDLLQERLYAENKRSVLLILQAMDTGGKDGTVRQVMKGMNPAGVRYSAFKAPTPHELAHDFLWRVHAEAPARGKIGIFNRSHYEDVLITRVHGWIDKTTCERRYKHINRFEKLLDDEGTRVVKCFLYISKDEQKERLRERLANPEKRWKFNPKDVEERKHWKAYMNAYEDAISATSTPEAPWYVVPANKKWYRNWVVAKILVETLKEMKPRFPSPKALGQVHIS